ncbi:MAG: hypothetical protein DRJ35_05415 [Thermoprotei archaeon]|nr:MAG: hypothetical protein DRJ35_05415 [Thermoprotei archaeon]
MEVTLARKIDKKSILVFLAENSNKSKKSLENIEKIRESILREHAKKEKISSMVEKALSTLKIPDPPLDEHDLLTGQKLRNYSQSLEELSKRLQDLARVFSEIDKLLPQLKQKTVELKKLAESLTAISPSLSSEILKLTNKSEKLLSSLDTEDPYRALDEAQSLLREGLRLEKIGKNVYKQTVSSILEEINATKLVLNKALAIAILQEKSILEKKMNELEKIESQLREILEKVERVDPSRLKEQIAEIRSYAEGFLSQSLSEEELRLAEEIAKLSSVYSGKNIKLDQFVDRLSKRADMDKESVLAIIYELARKGIVRVYIRL